MFTKTFEGKETFDACNAAENWLSERGYSFGPLQRSDPRGVVKGAADIEKWRNLSPKEDDRGSAQGTDYRAHHQHRL